MFIPYIHLMILQDELINIPKPYPSLIDGLNQDKDLLPYFHLLFSLASGSNKPLKL